MMPPPIMAARTAHRALIQATRSSQQSLPRFNCRRIPSLPPSRQLLHTSRSARQSSPEDHTDTDVGSYTPPPPRTFISYPVAALLAATSASFLLYRLFIYSPTSDTAALDPTRFTARHIALKQAISPTLSLFTLNEGAHDADDALWTQGIWSVDFKQPDLQIARAYTPLPPVKLRAESEGAWSAREKGLRFLIRRDPRGEVSPYVHALAPGAALELRGPTPELVLPADVSDVVFLAGGTGIAPALQVAYALSRRAARGDAGAEGAPVRMSILWASRTRDDTGANFGGALTGSFRDRYAAVPELLEAVETDARAGGRFALATRYFVDEEGQNITDADVRRLVVPPAQGPDQGQQGRKIILVSGPDGFVAHVAGAKELRGGREEQGAVRGLLGGLDLSGWQVWKL